MVKTKEGTKTIKLALYFWTDVGNKEKYEGIELPKKTCWGKGFVSIVSNNRHGLRSGIYTNFNNMEEITGAVNDVLKKSGITVIDSKKGNEYKEALKRMKEAELISN